MTQENAKELDEIFLVLRLLSRNSHDAFLKTVLTQFWLYNYIQLILLNVSTKTHSYTITFWMGVVTKEFLRRNSQLFHSGIAVGISTSNTYF